MTRVVSLATPIEIPLYRTFTSPKVKPRIEKLAGAPAESTSNTPTAPLAISAVVR